MTIEEAYRQNYCKQNNPELEYDAKAITGDKEEGVHNMGLGIDCIGFCKKILLSFVFVIVLMFICYVFLVEKQP